MTISSFLVAISLCVSVSGRRFHPGSPPSLPSSQSETFNFTCPGTNERPKINFANEKWPGNGNSQKYIPLTMDCVAAYPIYWEFIPPKGAYYNIRSKISVHNKDFMSGEATCYKEELRIETSVSYYSTRTGNYTCRSATNGKIASSVYVYAQDNDRTFSCERDYFEAPSRLVNGKEWLIPCPSNLEGKYFEVDLGIKEEIMSPNSTNTTEETTIVYPGYPSVRYDPQLGFLLLASNHSRPKGIYICGGATNKATISNVNNVAMNEIVFANMTDFNVIPSGDYVQYTNYKQIKVVCESDQDIYIDISKSYLLKQVKNPFQSKTDTFNFSVSYTLEETVDPKSDGKEGEIICKIKSSGKILHIWKHNIKKACNATIVPTPRDRDDIYYHPRDYYVRFRPTESNLVISNNDDNNELSMVVQSSICETKEQCDLAFRYFDHLSSRTTDYVTYGMTNQVNIYLRSSSTVIQCISDSTYVTLILAVAGINDFKINPTNWSSEYKINTSVIGNSENIFVGDSVPFLCRASKYFYNEGLKWELVFKNGSRAVVDSYNDTEVDIWAGSGTIIKASIFGLTDKNVAAVACYAHIWNSTSWESEKFDINHIEDRQIWDENAPIKCDGDFQKPTIVMKRNPAHAYYMNGRYTNGGVKFASHIVTNSEIIIQRGIESFFLYCIAAYPVRWTFSGVDYGQRRYPHESPGLGNGTTTTTTKNDTFHHCFQTTVHASTYSPDQTGEYRCERVNDKKVSSYAYIYVNTTLGGLINRGEHQTLIIDQSSPTITLPCRVTDPSVTVELFYHEDQGQYRKLNSTAYLSYDPKTGFILEQSSINMSSIYICTTANRTDISDALSFTFEKNVSSTVTLSPPGTTANISQNKSSTFFGFFFMISLIVTVISLQLWFLRKQMRLDQALSRIFGSYINMGSELTPNEFDRHSNGNTQLIPSLM